MNISQMIFLIKSTFIRWNFFSAARSIIRILITLEIMFKNQVKQTVLILAYFIFLLGSYTSTASAEVINIHSDELSKLIAEGVPIIDIRRSEEWQYLGVIEGSHKLTFFDQRGQYDAKKWLAETNKIAKADEPVIIICHLGVRSKVVSDWMSNQVGYQTVYNVDKGIDEWLRERKATVK